MADNKRLAENERVIKESFAKKELNCGVYYYSEVDSTMDAAKQQLKIQAEPMAVFVADMQKSGRGRQSRMWDSLPGNLFLTYSFAVPSDVSKLAGFSLVAGLATAAGLSNLGCRTRLKWPNDILSLSTKKLAGILVEIAQIGDKHYLLCGVGVNLVAVPQDLPNSASVKDINGQTYTPTQAVVKLAPSMKTYFDKFLVGGFLQFKNEWVQVAAFIGQDVSVHVSKDKKVSGMLFGVTSDGSLQIENGGKIETVTAGDLVLQS